MAKKVIHPKTSSVRKEAKSSHGKGGKEKGPMHEEENHPSSPPRHSTSHPTGLSAPSNRPSKGPKRTVLHNTREPPNLDSLDFKQKYGKTHSHYDPHRFASCADYEFYNQVLANRTLSSSFVVDLDALSKKRIDFKNNFHDLKWSSIFKIRKPVYPNSVREFYANSLFHDGELHSFVKNTQFVLNAETIGAALGYVDTEARVYISGKWDNSVGISHEDALARICENFSSLDDTTLLIRP